MHHPPRIPARNADAPAPRRRSYAPVRFRGISSSIVGLVVLLAAGILLPSQAQATVGGTLTVDHASAVAGWQLTFQGTAPVAMQQKVTLQRQLNGAWHDFKSVTTDSSGAFLLSAKQFAMPHESYRMRGSGFVTRTVTVDGINQNVEITASTTSPSPNQSFTLDTALTPAQQGRTVQFYRAAASGGWDLLGEAATNSSGVASLQVTGQGRYMAVAVAYQGACAYPSLVLTLPAPSLTTKSVKDPASSVKLSPMPSSANFSAEKTYSWWPAGENWDWEAGEGSAPWTATQNGSGNLSIFVGMIALLSGSYNNAIPSYGTTAATLSNNGHRYGRWEMRTKQKQFGSTGFTPYTIQLRLVRAGTSYRANPANVIVIGQWRGYSGKTQHRVVRKGVRYGYTSSGTQRNDMNFHNYAVELTRKHLTWLIDAKVVATAPARMVPSGRWVPQFVLKGATGTRMTSTRLASDWVRYFPLSSPNAKRLPQGPTPVRGG